MLTVDAPTITAIASVIALLVVAGGGLYRLGKLGNQVEQLQVQVRDIREDMRDIRQEMRDTRQEMREEMSSLRDEMREEMSSLRDEMREEMGALRDEMRRNHQQLLIALANHSHDEQGHAVFRMPAGAEPAPAP